MNGSHGNPGYEQFHAPPLLLAGRDKIFISPTEREIPQTQPQATLRYSGAQVNEASADGPDLENCAAFASESMPQVLGAARRELGSFLRATCEGGDSHLQQRAASIWLDALENADLTITDPKRLFRLVSIAAIAAMTDLYADEHLP